MRRGRLALTVWETADEVDPVYPVIGVWSAGLNTALNE
jgi:hypothetical protein